MKKVFTSTLLTVAAVPFLMAAPAAKKVQNQPPAATNSAKTVNTKKATKKHVKKSKANTETAAPSAAPQK